jgi:hypothetical protein
MLRGSDQIKMNPPKCDDSDYIHFLIAALENIYLYRGSPMQTRVDAPAHDAFTRLLQREPDDNS